MFYKKKWQIIYDWKNATFYLNGQPVASSCSQWTFIQKCVRFGVLQTWMVVFVLMSFEVDTCSCTVGIFGKCWNWFWFLVIHAWDCIRYRLMMMILLISVGWYLSHVVNIVYCIFSLLSCVGLMRCSFLVLIFNTCFS